jgi:uncharacterized protein YndB with AHSA1/START domain/DNA-binding transcriptional ArsR family regulator
MLDRLKRKPGLAVGELAELFPAMSRIGVMKHLGVLEDADLVVSRTEGKRRHLFLNAVPLQEIRDRWISRFDETLAPALTSIKERLERGSEKMETKIRNVSVIYIRATREQVWKALTDPIETQKYYFNTAIQSDLEPGGPLNYVRGADTLVAGKVLESIPYQKLSHTFAFTWMKDRPHRLTFELEQKGDTVKLTAVQDEFEGETETLREVRNGMPALMSSLKSLLETGKALEIAE